MGNVGMVGSRTASDLVTSFVGRASGLDSNLGAHPIDQTPDFVVDFYRKQDGSYSACTLVHAFPRSAPFSPCLHGNGYQPKEDCRRECIDGLDAAVAAAVARYLQIDRGADIAFANFKKF